MSEAPIVESWTDKDGTEGPAWWAWTPRREPPLTSALGLSSRPLPSDPRHDLRARMREIAQTRVRYGYRRIHVLLRRDGWRLGKNQMYRLYREEQLQLRTKLPKRRKMVVVRRERIRPRGTNEVWSLDFVSDQLADGTRFRALTVVDVFSREALAIEVGQRLGGEHVLQRVAS